ncbi:DEAD/DEAH box helicase [Actinoplanes sp. Pm04-4]|uniref:DEAD/DEAH box helicase n=1 Tax=Paractinoplanes pyxinae TaxID=2997416 RepID=A0ABT4B502_9ACTN|nr:DEAD/DEAH box helicase [Actinoplanes pyxinae]MCY1141575.1 DEAD/DEAH box helicase [Actinoplanes pyxinae]
MLGENQRRSAIARFWRSVEMFRANVLEPVDPAKWRFAVRSAAQVPWHETHRLRRRPFDDNKVWRHTVYGGIFTLDQMYHTLEDVFGSSDADMDERIPRGDSAVFAVRVTEDGRLLLDSLVITTAAWATGRAVNPGPVNGGWLEGFDLAASQIAGEVRSMLAAAADDKVAADYLSRDKVVVSRPIEHADLTAVFDVVIEQLGVDAALRPAGLRIHSERVSRRSANDTQPDLLNSFFLQDLQRVTDAAADGDVGPALAAYLAGEETAGALPHHDVRDSGTQDMLIDRLRPALVPVGRWPAKTGHPLATSQQLAVNVITEQLQGAAGTFGVNGPPGTGKTTLLRDLVASQVVQRAQLLAALRTPNAAFDQQDVGWNSDRGRMAIRPLRTEFTGFEMVVASMNNGAIDNVAKEIPQAKAIDQTWAGHSDYFADHAGRVLDAPAWALITAPLGKKSNRERFADRLWWGRTADRNAASEPGLLDWLRTRDMAAAGRRWPQAVDAFRTALQIEKTLREARQNAHEALISLPRLEHDLAVADRELTDASNSHDQARAAAAVAASTAANAQQHDQNARQRWQEHLSAKPGAWETLFTFGAALRRWRAAQAPFAATSAAAYTAAGIAVQQAWLAEQHSHATALQLQSAADRRDQAQQQVRAVDHNLDQIRLQCSDQVPDAAWRRDEYRREIAAPWLDGQWNAARTRVFLAALDLHAAFLAATASIIRNNLHAMIDILIGRAPGGLPERSIRAAWQTLFLLTPVVSSTFASIERMFAGLGREAIGWLLIDEAGQATPQAALGAVWRARRVVAVGDPLQLEPIIGVLHTIQQKLRRHHNVSETWLPRWTSVQILADRVTTVGTRLPGPHDAEVWVGAPLRVHRRCDDPMFTVINDAIYNQLMIHAVTQRPHPLTVPASSWIDVTSTDADGNWIPEETRTAVKVLEHLVSNGVPPTAIMAVTPFRDTAYHLRKLGRTYPGIVSGTVHVAQGKEADVVLFVLGGNPARTGTARWAASGPNLFNVAVSRAKQRLYVIGNHQLWSPLPYFSSLAQHLPRQNLR